MGSAEEGGSKKGEEGTGGGGRSRGRVITVPDLPTRRVPLRSPACQIHPVPALCLIALPSDRWVRPEAPSKPPRGGSRVPPAGAVLLLDSYDAAAAIAAVRRRAQSTSFGPREATAPRKKRGEAEGEAEAPVAELRYGLVERRVTAPAWAKPEARSNGQSGVPTEDMREEQLLEPRDDALRPARPSFSFPTAERMPSEQQRLRLELNPNYEFGKPRTIGELLPSANLWLQARKEGAERGRE